MIQFIRPSILTIIFLAGCLTGWLAPAALAGDYTITSSSPDLINFSTTGNLQPGDTIYLEAHTRQQLILQNITQGTAAAPITITNTGGQFIIDSGSSTTTSGWLLMGCQHVVVKGTPSPGNYDYGIKIAKTPSGQYGMAFIAVTNGSTIVGSSDFEVRDLEIGHTGYAGLGAKCDSLTASSGFVMENVKVHGLYIHDTGGEGIYIGSSDFHVSDRHEIHGVEIYDNLVVNTGWDGIQLGCATQGASIHDNVITGYGTGTTDTTQDEGIRSNPGTAADIYNNFIAGSPTNSGTGIFANPYDDVKYYNNVIVTPQEKGIYILETAQAKGYVSGYTVLLLNNTIISPGDYGIYFENPSHSANDRLLNNLIAAAPSGHNVSIYPSLLAEEAGYYYPTTVAAAGFVDAGDDNYRLTAGSAAVDAGVSTSTYGVTTDAEGVGRPQGSAFDAGAYEYAPPAVGIITPVAFGQAGAAYCPSAGAFDEQPTWDAINGGPTGVSANPYNSTQTGYASRHWYIDFGPDWADVRITGTWTRYMPYTTASYSGFGTMWWDDDNDATNDDGVTATGLNFGTAQSLNTGSGQPWVQDTDHVAAPIAPQRRYLIIDTASAPTTRANEFAISGYLIN